MTEQEPEEGTERDAAGAILAGLEADLEEAGLDPDNPAARRVLEHVAAGQPISRDINESFEGRLSVGQRLADRVAEFGGSWTFILIFAGFLALWTATNLLLAVRAFDPYPFIFLNLMLSMLAAVQAPIIMMSQNRQAAKDRLNARHDYEVNLKAELEIMALHDKLDRMRAEELRALIARQEAQIALLTRLVEDRKG